MQVYNTFNSVVFYTSNMVSCLFQMKSFDHCKRKLAPPIQDSNPLLVELEPSAVITRSIDTHRVGGRGGKSGIKQDPCWKIFKKTKNKNEVNTHRLYFPLNFFYKIMKPNPKFWKNIQPVQFVSMTRPYIFSQNLNI